VNAYVEDTWKINPHWTLDYGLRYELYTPISERAREDVELSEFVPTRWRWAGIFDQSAAYLSDQLERLGAPCASGLECAAGSACAHGRSDHGDSTEHLARQPSDRVNAFTLFIHVFNAAQNGEISYGFQITPNEIAAGL